MSKLSLKTRPWEMDAPSARDMIRAFCQLQEAVANAMPNGHDNPNDCFCGRGGFWNTPEYDGTPEGGFRSSGLALKAIVEAVEKVIINPEVKAVDDEHRPSPTFCLEGRKRRFWISKNGAVVSNMPDPKRYKFPEGITSEGFHMIIMKAMLDAAGDWHHYGGFLVCESCTRDDAERMVAALNFTEGLETDFIQRQTFKNLLPAEAF